MLIDTVTRTLALLQFVLGLNPDTMPWQEAASVVGVLELEGQFY